MNIMIENHIYAFQGKGKFILLSSSRFTIIVPQSFDIGNYQKFEIIHGI
jgi:hypothetical protein